MATANNTIKEASVSAVIRKADGTVIDLGVIAETKNKKLRKAKVRK
jgi:hypothetical protein